MKKLWTRSHSFSHRVALLATLLFLAVFSLEPLGGPANPGLSTRTPGMGGHFSKLPLSFEANLGQDDSRAQFLARGLGYGLFLTDSGAVLSLRDESSRTRSVILKARGANEVSRITPEGPLPGQSNYFLGQDPDRWITGVPHYSKVRYEDVYPGIDLVYYGNRGQIEFDFVVSPGADPEEIEFELQGVRHLEKAGQGLRLDLDGHEIWLRQPTLFQQSGSHRTEVSGSFVVSSAQTIRFEIGQYDRRKVLTIDPILEFSTALGSGDYDTATDIAVDAEGNAYIVGNSNSENFPTSTGSYQFEHGKGDLDLFIAKFDPTGLMFFSTFFGGSAPDQGTAIAINETGEIYFGGETVSSDLPVTASSYDSSCGSDGDCDEYRMSRREDGFVGKLNAEGNSLLFCSYLGGRSSDGVRDIALSPSEELIVLGITRSKGFPTTAGAYDPTCGTDGNCDSSRQDIFVSALDSSGASLLFSTFLGGSNNDSPTSIAVASSGEIHVVGYTPSTDFPVTSNAIDGICGTGDPGDGCADAFISTLNLDGTELLFSSYLGGAGFEWNPAVTVDPAGNLYVAGETNSDDFPVTPDALQSVRSGKDDLFLTAIDSNSAEIAYSTYFGGAGYEEEASVLVDGEGNVYLSGATTSEDLQTTQDAFNTTLSGDRDAFVSKVNPEGSALVFSTYLGGQDREESVAMSVDAVGSVLVAGGTESPDFPTVQAFQDQHFGGTDAFLFKLNTAGAEVVYSTLMGGGPSTEGASDLALDSQGNMIVVGGTSSPQFPVTFDAIQDEFGGVGTHYPGSGAGDGFVAKISASGNELLYSTFLGGRFADHVQAVAVDAQDDAYLTGYTGSNDFPTTPRAFDRECGFLTDSCEQPGSSVFDSKLDAFVTKLRANGTLEFSTFLGGPEDDYGVDIAVDNTLNPYVIGIAAGSFPTSDTAFQRDPKKGAFFVTKLDPLGSQLIYSTLLGGSDGEGFIGGAKNQAAIALDRFGRAFVTGTTSSADFPTTLAAFQRVGKGGNDGVDGFIYASGDEAFVTKFNLAGSALIYSTLLSGDGDENTRGIAVDDEGHAYVVGETASTDFPTTGGAFLETRENDDGSSAFVTKLSPDGDLLIYSTLLEGSDSWRPRSLGQSIAVDEMGRAHVTGSTSVSDFPEHNPVLGTRCGGAFVTQLNPEGSELPFSTCLGSSSSVGVGIVLDGDDIYVAGTTSSDDFPTVDSYQNPHAGGPDVFIAKIFPRVITISVQTGTPQSTPVETSFSEPLQLKVEDDQGNGVPDVEVTFSGPEAGPGAIFENGQTRASSFSDQDGIAIMPVAANSESGSYTIGAYTDVTEDPVTFDLTNLPGFEGCPGDLNDDVIRSVQDLFHIMLHLNQTTELSGDALIAADVNQDGSVDILDVVTLLRYFLGKESLPPCD